MNTFQIKVEKVDIKKLVPADYNPRKDLKPGDPDYEKLKGSLNNYGYVSPVTWNKRTGHVVGGHQRIKIFIELGITEIDVVVVDMSLADEKKLNLALNRIQGSWDEGKLADLLSELSSLPDFDLASTGFDLPEMSEILDSQSSESKEDDFDFQADLKVNEEPITKPGEIVEFNGHRVGCFDASILENLKKLMNGQKARLLDCDFPYNVDYMGGQTPRTDTRPKNSKKWDRIYSDNLPQVEYEAFMKKVLTNVKEVLVPGSPIYIWQGHRQFPPMYQILLDLGFYVSSVVCWLKESAAITYADYSFRTEQCLYGWLLGAPHYFGGPPGESNVWEIKRDPTKTYQHPTQKPIALAERAIKNSSKRGDIVLDTFLGSGSALLAAEALGRKCYGTEIDPKYVDGIVRRFIAYVGEDKVPNDLKERYLKKEQ